MGLGQRLCLRARFGAEFGVKFGGKKAIMQGYFGIPRRPILVKTGNNAERGTAGLIFLWHSAPAPFGQHHVMTTIRIKENEPFDVALRRFKRTIEKLGLLTDLRAREFYEKPTAERKRKKAAAVKRNYKRIRSMQLPKKLF